MFARAFSSPSSGSCNVNEKCTNFFPHIIRFLFSTSSHVIEIAQNFCTDTVTTAEKSAPPPAALLLLLSRTCYDLQLNTAQYLMAMVDEQFLIEDTSGLTSVPKVNGLLKTVSQMLLNHYVKMQGGIMSQMLRKSVETRDWLNTVEPRSVRAVMKRVVEEVTAVDRQVGGFDVGEKRRY